tara:strand:+ start:970 stop:2703 length:1734 start_codon:yes stop_codon:yes gene_type:complete
MANIIACNLIEAEVDRLKELFEPCYQLRAEDLDSISDLVFSASLCSNISSGIDQNNIIQDLTAVGFETPSGSESVSTFVNSRIAFTVGETIILNVVNSYAITVDLFRTRLVRDHYLLKLGKGTYGTGGTTLNDDDFILYSSTNLATLSSSTALPPEVLNVTSSTTDLDNPHTAANDEGPFTLSDDKDSFFIVSPASASRPVPTKVYRFIGTAGNYGLGQTPFVLGDFLLVEDLTLDTTGQIPSSDKKITIRELAVGATIKPTGAITNIAEAVNNSFRGIITIKDTELLWFRVQRELSFSGGAKQLVTEGYAWNKGQGTIASNSVLTDYTSRIEREEGITVEKTNAGFGDTIILDVVSDLITNPSKGLNEAVSTVVSSNDLYVKVVSELADINDPDYSLYRFTGGDGTYGSGGTATVHGDFVLIETYRDDIVGSDNPYTIKQIGDNLVGFESPLKQVFVGATVTQDGTDGSSIITITPNLPTPNIGNTILVSVAGAYTEASIFKEKMASTVGSVVSLTNTPLLNTVGFNEESTVDVYRDGLLQEETADFTLSGLDITFVVALAAPDVVIVKYLAIIAP